MSARNATSAAASLHFVACVPPTLKENEGPCDGPQGPHSIAQGHESS
jgi:hypothetical protein